MSLLIQASNSELLENNPHLIAREDLDLIDSTDNKGIKVVSDDRYTSISIEKKYKSTNENETFVNTHILKDKLLKTTETQIKKVFIHKNEGEANVIIREINIDRYNNQSISEHKSIFIKLDETETLEGKISSLLEFKTPHALLN